MSDLSELYERAGREVQDRAAAVAGERADTMQWGTPYEVDHKMVDLVRLMMGGYVPDELLPHIADHAEQLTGMIVSRLLERVEAQGGLSIEELVGTFYSLLIQSVAVGVRTRQLIDEAERRRG